eukprot:CAMPEP_0184392814 /NCGR_PEP_ID=MMETSP0007-20130409/29623_1 /TAXON_ID=97485 /ORGANISM="Prymnesium parvum, Strain Texoma1" /LENGTH=153 /DNA_ID=CAMNT_0026743503 /DNA_START=640 /DNA_END=1097 /DNA_ORIENTATION=+
MALHGTAPTMGRLGVTSTFQLGILVHRVLRAHRHAVRPARGLRGAAAPRRPSLPQQCNGEGLLRRDHLLRTLAISAHAVDLDDEVLLADVLHRGDRVLGDGDDIVRRVELAAELLPRGDHHVDHDCLHPRRLIRADLVRLVARLEALVRRALL